MADNAAMTSRLPDSAALPASCWQAELRLEFGLCGARTVLEGNRHRGPLRVQKALYPEGEGVCQAIVLHPPSGIAGGDRLSLTAHLGPGAHAQLTTPGAGKWYRSAGLEASQTLDFTLAAGAALEWLPQETIVFDGARARMGATVALAADARYIGWDILCLGRRASGERFATGRCDMALSLSREGHPLWHEQGGFDGADRLLTSPIGWAGATVSGTLLCAFPELSHRAVGLLQACRAIAPADGSRHGLTVLPGPGGGVLAARYLGDGSEAARQWFVALWQILRPACCGRGAVAPRIWNT